MYIPELIRSKRSHKVINERIATSVSGACQIQHNYSLEALQSTVAAGITGFENPTHPYRESVLNLTELFIHSKSSSQLKKTNNSLVSLKVIG